MASEMMARAPDVRGGGSINEFTSMLITKLKRVAKVKSCRDNRKLRIVMKKWNWRLKCEREHQANVRQIHDIPWSSMSTVSSASVIYASDAEIPHALWDNLLDQAFAVTGGLDESELFEASALMR
eukprot:CAMPEP_0113674252 /NCGR_PEP_ID=MMETSP0038_2-20120614/7309_1 /TAXON_ID=2898 /ORGANISM="Cryptomonas paramecium" /LENGTH=124 /DNA_ID=CAMNT_0000590799 /DNA_START=48 /DNA_END=418 /DNA_ORIENTATION=+ /assembly_acc=CAM_ASM_000170